MRRAAFLFLLSFSLLTFGSYAYAGQTCIATRGCADLTTTTCVVDTTFTSQGGKPNPRACTDATNGFRCDLTFPSNVGTVSAALYTYGVDAAGNVRWQIECACVAVGEEAQEPTLGTASIVTDADVAAGDLNKVTWSDVAAICAGSCTSGEKLIANVNRLNDGSDTDTDTQRTKEFCLEY